jgi:aspartate aminotransferase-like enzyme/N-acyl-L-homoserine lactone synthetase
MLRVGKYVFKRAETKQEFDQIHRLNHRTFVEEIAQHSPRGGESLVDKFHDKNSYLIAVREDQVVAMIGAHDQAPFSVAERLPDPAVLKQPGMRPLEVRLLAIEPSERNNIDLFFGLMYFIYEHARKNGYTHLFISAYSERLNLYEKLGFAALGPAVTCGAAAFVPMMLKLDKMPLKALRVKQRWLAHVDKTMQREFEPICLLPGPVTISRTVREAFHEPPIYHRGPEFIDRFVKMRHFLGEMVGGRDVAILNGSGTLANETVAATLAAERVSLPGVPGRGVLLINGEFGERLAKQAVRFGLEPRVLSWAWGEPWNLEEIEEALASEPEGSWIWGVHQESSTGVLNDLPGLVRIARRRGVRVCVDCISSLGAVPLDLSQVYLASGTSGKSLASFAGAAIVFADKEALSQLDRRGVPSYFDLLAHLSSEGPCYTFPSPTLAALERALQEYATPQQAQAAYARYHEIGVQVRQELRRVGLTPLAPEQHASPVITTFAPPDDETSLEFVNRCRAWGFSLGGESGYLSKQRYVQIATMGPLHWEQIYGLFDRLESYLAKKALLAPVC